MTREMARRILDAVKDGAKYNSLVIRHALFMTGDLDYWDAE